MPYKKMRALLTGLALLPLVSNAGPCYTYVQLINNQSNIMSYVQLFNSSSEATSCIFTVYGIDGTAYGDTTAFPITASQTIQLSIAQILQALQPFTATQSNYTAIMNCTGYNVVAGGMVFNSATSALTYYTPPSCGGA